MPTRAYETLIRHNADGSIGAHHTQIREIYDEGELVAARVLDPIPLHLVDTGTGLTLANVLGEATATALAQAEADRAVAANAIAARQAAETALAIALQERDEARQQLAQALAANESLTAQLAPAEPGSEV